MLFDFKMYIIVIIISSKVGDNIITIYKEKLVVNKYLLFSILPLYFLLQFS